MNAVTTIRTIADIEQIEQQQTQEVLFAGKSTFAVIEEGATINPDGIALSFLQSGELYEQAIHITYKDFLQKIRQTANLFDNLGVGPNDVVTYLLPNLPQAHFVLWGAEAVGIANPINPMLEAETIRQICCAAKTKVLVALGDLPGTQIWQKVLQIKAQIPSLKHILCVSGTGQEIENGISSFESKLVEMRGDCLQFNRTIDANTIASLYHTGGTTGTPKLAPHTHMNEIAMGWMICCSGGITVDKTLLCGLPLFHVNATTITGIAPFSVGAQVVLLSPAGYRDADVIKNFYNIVAHYKANFFAAVPTVLSCLLDVPVGPLCQDSCPMT